MNKKKKEEKEVKTPKKGTTKKKEEPISNIEIEKFSIYELLEKNGIKSLDAVGFLSYYGLVEEFKKEFEGNKNIVKFSEGEFRDMYERYIEREI